MTAWSEDSLPAELELTRFGGHLRTEKGLIWMRIAMAGTALFAVSFFEVRDGRIARAEEYFADNTSPPFDRSARTDMLK